MRYAIVDLMKIFPKFSHKQPHLRGRNVNLSENFNRIDWQIFCNSINNSKSITMKKIILSAIMLAGFATFTSAQTPQKTMQDKKKMEQGKSKMDKMDTTKSGTKDWSDKKMKKKTMGKKGSDTTGVK